MKIEVGNINIESILLSGACFRVIKEEDGSFTNILKDRVVNIKQDGNYIIVNSSNMDNIENIIKEYFDLNRDYNKINNELLKNKYIKNTVSKCYDYRILNQDPFEISISYIISQNNNVKRISKSINEISNKYGNKITFNNKEYHLFPTYEQIKNIKIEELKEFGVGFRDKYIINYLNEYNDLYDLDKLNTEEALKRLMNIKGIGLKVASCILLFGYKRLDVFPIDTWVKKYIVEHYNIKDDVKEIKLFAEKNFKEYSGLVIQYMFHEARNTKDA